MKFNRTDTHLTKQIIFLRYGRYDVQDRSQPARCSLPVIAKYLGVTFNTVQRLYRAYFSGSAEKSPTLTQRQLELIISENALRQNADLSLADRVAKFNKQCPRVHMTVQRMRKIYGMVNIKYKTVREELKNVDHSEDRTRTETAECQRLLQKAIKEKFEILPVPRKTWTLDITLVKTQF